MKQDLTGLVRIYRDYSAPLFQFTKRYLSATFRSSSLGWLWLLLQPLAMMVAYTLVFGYVFKGHYGHSATETNWDYAITVYLSLTVFGFATDVIGGSIMLLDSQRSLLANTRIPAEVLVLASVQAAAVRFLFALAPCLILARVISTICWTGFWVIPLFAGYALFLLGLAFILSVLGVIMPDLRQLVGLVTTVLMFSSAVFYPVALVPIWMQSLNPVLSAVVLTREFVLWGGHPGQFERGLAVEWIGALVFLALGLALLRRNRARLTD
jgi:lipopolysaccharide transport system permease protein